ncbi:hypothetical protein CDAR_253481 [Caerostris darwini]|uniref:Uncharacterized protein n=1 Tax=Caerostris darwini TaxID=1538125 RepID=A0AAV4MJF0_9ARAC|nr:hypothetical protein CDAR_253481 [Caerostris darwini]
MTSEENHGTPCNEAVKYNERVCPPESLKLPHSLQNSNHPFLTKIKVLFRLPGCLSTEATIKTPTWNAETIKASIKFSIRVVWNHGIAIRTPIISPNYPLRLPKVG